LSATSGMFVSIVFYDLFRYCSVVLASFDLVLLFDCCSFVKQPMQQQQAQQHSRLNYSISRNS